MSKQAQIFTVLSSYQGWGIPRQAKDLMLYTTGQITKEEKDEWLKEGEHE